METGSSIAIGVDWERQGITRWLYYVYKCFYVCYDDLALRIVEASPTVLYLSLVPDWTCIYINAP